MVVHRALHATHSRRRRIVPFVRLRLSGTADFILPHFGHAIETVNCAAALSCSLCAIYNRDLMKSAASCPNLRVMNSDMDSGFSGMSSLYPCSDFSQPSNFTTSKLT